MLLLVSLVLLVLLGLGMLRLELFGLLGLGLFLLGRGLVRGLPLVMLCFSLHALRQVRVSFRGRKIVFKTHRHICPR